MINRDFGSFQIKSHILGGKMGVTETLTPKGLGPQNSTKNLAYRMDLLDQPKSRFQKFRA